MSAPDTPPSDTPRRLCRICGWPSPPVVSLAPDPILVGVMKLIGIPDMAELEDRISKGLVLEHVVSDHPDAYRELTGRDPAIVLAETKAMLEKFGG